MSEAAEPRLEPRVTLIVDDDAPFCAALAAALRRRGEKVVVAHDAAEALREAGAWEPERATVDLRLGAESGVALVRELKRRFPALEIVVLTGYGSIATAVEAVKAGAVHYLTKPASVESILQAFEPEAGDAGESSTAEVASLDDVEREHLARVLHEVGGNVSEAARRLGLHRRTLQRKLARYR
ncbi:MAG TPA: response regulator [Polyangiaceae bacterium]|nr:response regulator [Polyangiaceae bacterium]